MTKAEALYNYFNSFGLNAYPVNNVPTDVTFPWLTYDAQIGCFGEETTCQVQIWFHTESEAVPNDKADEIAKAISMGGKILDYDDGVIWVKRGTPWAQALSDESDSSVKGRLLNIILEFL